MKRISEKKVAAVLFTDIEGYSLVSNQNQERGLEMARIHREVIQFCVAIYGGDCINFYGDGSLSLFSNANEAVSCAIQMQRRFRMAGGIPVRIGIHAGEVLCDAGSVYGDTINIASRIQNIAPKGGILVSREVYERTDMPGSFRMVGIGSENLKNIPHPIGLYYVDHPDVTIPAKGEVHRRAVAKSEVQPKFRTGVVYLITLIAAAFTAMAAIFIDTKQQTSLPPEYDAKLTVWPFYNLTGNPDDSVIGSIAANRIMNCIRELPGTDVVNYTFPGSPGRGQAIQPEENRHLSMITHAENLILGKYFREGDSIVFKAELINLVTKRYIHIWAPQKSHFTDPMEGLRKLENAIVRFWMSKYEQSRRTQDIKSNDAFFRISAIREDEGFFAPGYFDHWIRRDLIFPGVGFPVTKGHENRRLDAPIPALNLLIFQKPPPKRADVWLQQPNVRTAVLAFKAAKTVHKT